jgi:MFS family permease
MRALLRDRNFRLLASGQLLNQLGDQAMFLALGIWAKALTGSNAQAGIVFLLFAIPGLIAPFLGVFVDRMPRRRLLIATDLATAALMLSLLLVHDRHDVWMLQVVALLYGASGQIYFAARSGLLVSMLPTDKLAEANGMLASVGQGVQIGGPLLGAALFALAGGGTVAVLDAATFLCSAALLFAIRVIDLEPPTERPGFLREAAAGIAHAWSTPQIRRLLVVTAIALGALGITQGGAVFALIGEGLHRPPSFLGVLATLQGLGAIAGGLIAGRVIGRLGELRSAGVAVLAFGIGCVGLLSSELSWVLPAILLIGVGISIFLVAYNTLLQRLTPIGLQGRVAAAGEAVVSVPYVLSIAIGAALVSAVSYRVLFGACAAGLATSSIGLLTARNVPRDVELGTTP